MIAPMFLLAAMGAPAPACDAPVSQADMNLCARRDYEAADAQLNAEWRKATATMKARDEAAGPPTDRQPTYAAALLQSQRAWLSYRDAQCRLAGYSMRGGTAEPLTVSTCLEQLTRTRIQQLKDLQQGY
ncbi:MAG: lysozyme inhibitor LprI family protein [Sphingobium sp.]